MDMDIASLVCGTRHEPTCYVSDTIGKALARVGSSHEAVFVLDGNDSFVGLLSPYELLYRQRVPYRAKVSAWMMQPPHIHRSTSLFSVASFMASLKTYTLPVFDETLTLEGYITAESVLRTIAEKDHGFKHLSHYLAWKTPVTGSVRASVSDIYNTLRSHGVARVVLVDESLVLAGIVARSDLHPTLIMPPDRQRFRSKVHIPGSLMKWFGNSVTHTHLSFNEAHAREMEIPITSYAHTQVLTVGPHETLLQALESMFTHSLRSVVRVDGKQRPIGFLSWADYLKAIARMRPVLDVPIQISLNVDDLRDYFTEVARWYLEDFVDRCKRKAPIRKVIARVEVTHSSSGRPSLYTIRLQMQRENRAWVHTIQHDRIYRQALQDALITMKRLLAKNA